MQVIWFAFVSWSIFPFRFYFWLRGCIGSERPSNKLLWPHMSSYCLLTKECIRYLDKTEEKNDLVGDVRSFLLSLSMARSWLTAA
jgi:hypothetical protein